MRRRGAVWRSAEVRVIILNKRFAGLGGLVGGDGGWLVVVNLFDCARTWAPKQTE